MPLHVRNELLIHGTLWVDLESIMLNEKSKSQKSSTE